ncbi:MAG: Rrf2 family transcriptional regulator [Ignavibacteriaceae bacterium]|nr:Rrf2 family transcriptional regulator [Ignavibacterium sp.]MCC6255323.1 Rrf2 family transcriptional regulator [Ignavibacteriaceae bacterium]HMN25094.1 Rrf2 family transcriptional regulator [Ignavibacteriaceae bacterium]HRN27352.1 Rrf2 family transcriptional regulator [Ignavibacteriaceae bacterium]HRP93271.1 Rrf2 family transcriptional regulator [Ignavibacteriaceae bacterium]
MSGFFYLLFLIQYVTLTVTIIKIMSASTKLSTSVKALCYLAIEDKPKNSSEIAASVGINASKLRKLLSMLGKAGIVKSDSGMLGGFSLAKKPNQIHLQEIYCAIEDRKAFYLNVNDTNLKQNGTSEKINSIFLNLFSQIQVEIENKMIGITLKSIIDKIK